MQCSVRAIAAASAILQLPLQKPSLVHEASYVNGEFLTAAENFIAVKNPATNELLGRIPDHGIEVTNAAIAAAADAQVKWAAMMPRQRAKVLLKWSELMFEHHSDLAQIITAEGGKPLAEADGENTYSAGYVEWFAGEAERIYGDIMSGPRPGMRVTVRKKPVGVVAVITPWNFPSAMLTRAAAAALAAGCTVVARPSTVTPFSAAALADLSLQAGLPAGCFNVLMGRSGPIGKALTDSHVVRKLCFTGSTEVGKKLMCQCAGTVKKLAMELGGNAPFIVFEDADIDLAVAGLVSSKFRNAGQTCICVNRVYVHESIAAAFTAKFVEACKKLRIGNGVTPGVQMGPLITSGDVTRMEKLVEDEIGKGAKLECGGGRPIDPSLSSGNFYLPTVLSNVKHTSGACCSELFGPVAPIVTFKTDDEVINYANDTTAGLASYFYTRDYRRHWSIPERLKYGMVGINEGLISTPIAPFGGVKESGLGRDGSKYGIEGFLDVTYVCHGGL